MAPHRKSNLSVKELESRLQELDDFEEPKVKLEQYATPPQIAALLLNEIHQTHDEIEGRIIADLGCGTGRLTVGSLLCGASMVYGFDIDDDALRLALENISETFSESSGIPYIDCTRFNLVSADLMSPRYDLFWAPFSKMFDTVIMNPPFGTKQNPGADLLFLQRAIELSSNVVYSLHKTSTRRHILNRCQSWNIKGKPIAQIRYNLDQTYRFHKKKSVDIDVDLWRIVVSRKT